MSDRTSSNFHSSSNASDRKRRNARYFFAKAAVFCPVLALIGLYLFSTSFFLAKRSMPHKSTCDDDSAKSLLLEFLGLTGEEIDGMSRDGVISDGSNSGDGCWMDRRVDSMVVIVVDALRFDFAKDLLPNSIGARLEQQKSRSELMKFVADPPTVTMQRLKGLTTGGLPTFADISGSFGGASVDEDTWVQQLKDTPLSRRGFLPFNRALPKLAFVGDDTWVDLFPTQFDDCHPFPSFNSRDLDTVDNGCLEHLPRLIERLGRSNIDQNQGEFFEVVVAHFLGVDHVGHTYGPHNEHMAQKLKQMDSALSAVLDRLDESQTHECQVAFIFGDHGMTEDGNHGGGTEYEINAALFAHFSPGCGDMSTAKDLNGSEGGVKTEEAFQSINQIDLVPTISVLLGLPIPYANIGAVVPSLLPSRFSNDTETPRIAAALALNAAQVWRYLSMYSQTANALPSLPELETLLQDATLVYKSALSQEGAQDSLAYREACAKFKLFLADAVDLGKRVWTRFDTTGMMLGAAILFVALLFGIPTRASLNVRPSPVESYTSLQYLQLIMASLFMLFQCAILTFSNSYILAEQSTIMFFLAILCTAVSGNRGRRLKIAKVEGTKCAKSSGPLLTSWLPLILVVCARFSELWITGHGLDPSLRQHMAHNSSVFLTSLILLAMVRWEIYRRGVTLSRTHVLLDMTAMLFLAWSWVEKRSLDHSRNGFALCGIALLLLVSGILFTAIRIPRHDFQNAIHPDKTMANYVVTGASKLLLMIVAVTGPSAATSSVMFVGSVLVLFRMTLVSGEQEVPSLVLSALWRLVIRHTFFVTNHACAFNRLQYSAAFVMTDDFQVVTGGISLFLNTFGWEILGLVLVVATALITRRKNVWAWFCFFQLLESFTSCISVSLMRRHLMVWAIFAPRFVFAAIFLLLNILAQFTALCFM